MVRGRGTRVRCAGGFTLPQILLALALLGIAAAAAVPAGSRAIDAFSLRRSGDLARGHVIRARLVAVGRRETVRVRAGPEATLRLEDAEGSLLSVTGLQAGLLRLDSVRIRPATLRFNARGQAAPGSLYLYRGKRGLRVVVNFLGRVRRETFRLP